MLVENRGLFLDPEIPVVVVDANDVKARPIRHRHLFREFFREREIELVRAAGVASRETLMLRRICDRHIERRNPLALPRVSLKVGL